MYFGYMSLLTIVAVLQAALSLLSAVQVNQNLPNEVKLQAVDLASQAVEVAIGGIADLAHPNASETDAISASQQ